MIAVMQPYIFPYLGYYQLVNLVDVFVLYDDVNFIKGGYINRNNILVNGAAQRFTLPVPGASSNKKICELSFSLDAKKILKTISQAYSKAPFYSDVYPLIEMALQSEDRSIASVCQLGIKSVFDYLGVEKKIIKSTDLSYDRGASPADRLIEITKSFEDSIYVNSIGGQALYDKGYFYGRGVELKFLKMKSIQYTQSEAEFIPNLSIIDVLMWCEPKFVKKLLNEYVFL
ncbi:WbqC family protein [Vibrio fluvialis]|uniref:WbqC family protein n=1 Tax=Vibrio fluvialis TaxID=676 RepID=UPI001F254159|nr:WbqC family protein [Vibrio fluvialis]MCE7648612.1 WbqC family protein [Vibrio fluvialis]UPO64629.1 glycosyl transferase [Vibrio fluvialis]